MGNYDAVLREAMMEIEKREVTLCSGEKVWIEYDREGDLLEIIFRPTEATCAVELTESMVLRFNWDTNEPVSLSLISFSKLRQPTAYGEVHFQLLTEEWPEEAQDKIWTMLRTIPLAEFLKLSSYIPAHTDRIIPTTTLKQPEVLSQAA
jgi:hypothetical protein